MLHISHLSSAAIKMQSALQYVTRLVTTLALLAFTSAMPSPTTTVTELKCHCLIFKSTSGLSPCNPTSTAAFDWHTAQKFASDHNIRIQFFSSSTISQVLEVDRPLPSSMLMRMSDGGPIPLDDTWATDGVQKIICGFNDEVSRLWHTESQEPVVSCAIWAWHGVLILLLLVVVYAAGEEIWRRYDKTSTTMFRQQHEVTLVQSSTPMRSQTIAYPTQRIREALDSSRHGATSNCMPNSRHERR